LLWVVTRSKKKKKKKKKKNTVQPQPELKSELVKRSGAVTRFRSIS
jgi:hypothetical protein